MGVAQGESVVLRARDGSTVEGTATITRWTPGQRGARAGGIAGAGLLVGAGTIVIPFFHFFAPWLVWLVSLGLAAYVAQIRSRIDRVEGACVKCGTAIRSGPFGAATDDEPLWVRCPSCKLPHEVRWTP